MLLVAHWRRLVVALCVRNRRKNTTHTHTLSVYPARKYIFTYFLANRWNKSSCKKERKKKKSFNLQGKSKYKSMNKHMVWLKRVVSFINSISQINECSLAQQVIYASTESLAFGGDLCLLFTRTFFFNILQGKLKHFSLCWLTQSIQMWWFCCLGGRPQCQPLPLCAHLNHFR